ncbi:MAG: hypothetical protein IH897_07565 [Planctomycetes bacterium]|nr:hypothetical protein [Planctomycetota bacterium]
MRCASQDDIDTSSRFSCLQGVDAAGLHYVLFGIDAYGFCLGAGNRYYGDSLFSGIAMNGREPGATLQE